jgi:BirA family biotin operon repressor/biotin-[acetyl-CoA-carboxylase] ligase
MILEEDAMDDWDSIAPPGWTVHHRAETESTNDLAKAAGLSRAPESTVFVADHQLKGRGRLDRTWLELTGSSLLFSILFRRQLPPLLLTMICSVASCEAIQKLAGVLVEIKWPNDLMLNGRKLAGVLTEVNWASENQFTVVGMGINLNFDPPLIDGIPNAATSLLRETGTEVPSQQLLGEILHSLDAILAMEHAELESHVRAEWASRLWRRRQKVTVADGTTILEGIFEDVGADGVLLLRLDDGTLTEVRVGDLLM